MSQVDARNMPQRRSPLRLPVEVAERIAAGEVIERPASVVKELVENALDAGAHDIRVELRGGGQHMIRVRDDGCGILESDLAHLCARHTTSKISAYEDLEQLGTLGFRGEALASIAAVSEMTLVSRAIETEKGEDGPEEQPAAWAMWRGGELSGQGKRARSHGTTVTVRTLFYNVPARLKFLRKASTESAHVLQMLRRYALGYPDVRFSMAIDEHMALQTSGSGDVATTLVELYNLSLQEMLSAVNVSEEGRYSIRGYIGNRALANRGRQYVTLFVNGRWVNVPALQAALEEGYRGALPKGYHPLLVLYLKVPPQEVDVNVHPAKTEIRLERESEIASALRDAVRAVLERSPARPEVVRFPGPVLASQRRLPGPRRRGLHMAETAEEYRAMAEADPADNPKAIASLSPLAQLQQALILAEAPDGSLYLVDQHRAHERVIYEHLRRNYGGLQEQQGGSFDAYMLLEPVIIELKGYQAELLEQRLPVLNNLGLECERFGGRSFLIRSVPAGERAGQLVDHLRELVDIASADNTDWENHLLIGLACRSALRRGRELSLGEQRSLLKALSETLAPAVCPHGSPILLYYSRKFLTEKFSW
ncbi:MAG: DNA mismatch repair endonuclease MutL [Ktedonobacteraceae bacterium]|nr:DNA mismatch repair endonuclease MutL [Ktedonobacteraceae bacterium]